MNTKSPPARCAMLARSPVSRLSMPTTAQSRLRSSSARWEPMNPAAPVMTTRRLSLMATFYFALSTLFSAREDAAEQRHPHDFEVERHRPVFDVIQIELDALLERGVPAPAVDLRPPGDARLDLMAQHVLREAVLELIDEKRPLGPWSDDRHVTLQ